MNQHKVEAEKHLADLRENPKDYKYLIYVLCEALQNSELAFADIGTSGEEIKKLRVKSHMTMAKEWLTVLRKGHEYYDVFVEALRNEIQDGELTLQEIDTSEEEIEQLRVKGSILAAKNSITLLRAGTKNYVSITAFLKEEVQKFKLSLADIGTSEGELAVFAQDS